MTKESVDKRFKAVKYGSNDLGSVFRAWDVRKIMIECGENKSTRWPLAG